MSQTEDDAEYIEMIEDYRARKDQAFAASPDSPLSAAVEAGEFSGLSYFPPDPTFCVVASVTPFSQPEVVQLGSTKGDIRPQLRYAELHFTVNGQELKLTGYQDPDATNGDELFVPFRDATTGKESYGAGRYLEVDLEQGEDGSLTTTLDFNLAYSPWCAYNSAYSCTLPPQENTLSVAIRAGERTYGEHA